MSLWTTRIHRGNVCFSVTYLLIPLVVVALIVGILEIIPANSYILLPGQALSVAPMISIKGYPTRPKSGRLYMVDVSVYKADHLLEQLLYSHLYSGADVEPAQNVTGGLSDQQYNQYNVQAMSDSIHQAEAAALSQVPGLHPTLAKTGPRVSLVFPGMPAAKKLRQGDVIEYVDGQRVHRAAQVGVLIRSLHPGAVVHMRVLRGKRLVTVAIKTIATTNGVPDKHGKTPLIGIYSSDQVNLPVKISIQPGDIEGPSAGLMFSLGIIQHIEKRDIAHGCRIAGTGTIDLNGNVGAIGGAKQKIIAAENSGAQYFFVPDVAANRNPARQYAHNITVVPVKTLPQALRFLKNLTPCDR